MCVEASIKIKRGQRQRREGELGRWKNKAGEVLYFIMAGFITLYFPLKQEIDPVSETKK